MNKMDVHFSSGTDNWETPQYLFEELDDEFHFEIDLAASFNNSKCKQYLDESHDSPNCEWNEYARIGFCNPPYSKGNQKRFIETAARQRLEGFTTVMLIPARTDTKIFHECIWDRENHCPREGIEVRFLKSRLKFEINGKPVLDKHGRPQSAPFPSMVVVFRGHNECY